MDWVVVHGTRKLAQVKDTFQYIPIIGILQAMLQNKAIYKEVKKVKLCRCIHTYVAITHICIFEPSIFPVVMCP